MNKFFLTIISFLALAFLTNCSARKTTAAPLTTDIGVTINGITWATRNVDAPGTFAANPEDAGMIFQWGKPYGWRATLHYTDKYVDDWAMYLPTQRWNFTIGGWENSNWVRGGAEGTEWETQNDPCPAGWRVPTKNELQSLIDADSEWITQNGVNGYLFGAMPYQVFLPVAAARCAGYGVVSAEPITGGHYWSNERLEYWSPNSHLLWFSERSIPSMGGWMSGAGYSIRCVKIK